MGPGYGLIIGIDVLCQNALLHTFNPKHRRHINTFASPVGTVPARPPSNELGTLKKPKGCPVLTAKLGFFQRLHEVGWVKPFLEADEGGS